MDISELLKFSIKNKSSDLHLSTGEPPIIRVDGDLRKLELPALCHEEMITMLHGIMNEKQIKDYQEHLETDFSFELPGEARFRVNVFTQVNGAAAVFRVIPSSVQTMEAMGFPPVFKRIAEFANGLVLVTGPTGSGKSTTLAAMIDYINNNVYRHIITIEDPIEFVHTSNQCLINQREVHRDTHSFHAALRSALREDPDIILIGELRDLETIRLAMTAAETGHLVFATLHTNSATKTINRIIDVFPGDEKSMIRSMLSDSLQAVIAQTLLKKMAGGRIPAFEIMICNAAIRNLIREDKIPQMYSVIQTGQSAGMQTMDQHLMKMVSNHIINEQLAKNVSISKNLF